PAWWSERGWGFCMAVLTKTDAVGRNVGAYGWDGGFGTVWCSDPALDLVTILMTQRAWESPNPPNVSSDFWRSAYAASQDCTVREEEAVMELPKIVAPVEWQVARDELLVKEKEATRARDALAAERRRLPMVQIDKEYVFEGQEGKASLVDLFDGRR